MSERPVSHGEGLTGPGATRLPGAHRSPVSVARRASSGHPAFASFGRILRSGAPGSGEGPIRGSHPRPARHAGAFHARTRAMRGECDTYGEVAANRAGRTRADPGFVIPPLPPNTLPPEIFRPFRGPPCWGFEGFPRVVCPRQSHVMQITWPGALHTPYPQASFTSRASLPLGEPLRPPREEGRGVFGALLQGHLGGAPFVSPSPRRPAGSAVPRLA